MLSVLVKNELEKVLGPSVGSRDQEYISKLGPLVRKYKNVTRIQDSLSQSELHSKSILIKAIESQGLVDSQGTIVIWGCWYGSILIPYFSSRVSKVIGIDRDDEAIRFAKNKLFCEIDNVDFITDDIFSSYRDFYLTTNLIVNPSCDYMRPMNQWPWFQHGALSTDPEYPKGAGDKNSSKKRVFMSPKLSSDCHFAFQSSNLVGADGRINCVKSLDEFKAQLPTRAELWFEDETEVDGGRLFTLLGKFK